MRTLCWSVCLLAATIMASPSRAADEAGVSAAPKVVLETSLGKIRVELDPQSSPVSVENFLKYVNSGFYKGTIFHRVIDGFMVQGGGFTPGMKKKTTPYPPIKLESRNGLKNKKYTVAMARTSDPGSATSQFFINVVDNPRLDYPNPDGHGYAVFGKVVEGFDVVDKIRTVKTTTSGQYTDVPVEPVLILSATAQGQ